MPDSPPSAADDYATEVHLSNGRVLQVQESVETILTLAADAPPPTLAGAALVRLTLRDGRPVFVAAAHIVSVQPPPAAEAGRAVDSTLPRRTSKLRSSTARVGCCTPTTSVSSTTMVACS